MAMMPSTRRKLRRTASPLALWGGAALCVVAPAHAASAGTTGVGGAAGAAAQVPDDDPMREILIIAPLFRDIQPERQLDAEEIEGYGSSTIDELLGEVQAELGDDSAAPLIIVNGQRIDDLSDIGGLPVEALRGLQILPRGSATALGGRPGQRVVNLTLKNSVRSATVTAAHKVATDGDWNGERGEAILTRVQGKTRANLTLRARDDAPLFESGRGIIQPLARYPYAIAGNVIGYPGTNAEIDPALSALAGQIVTVTPLPTAGAPNLEAFLAGANQPALTDLGRYRTLRPEARNFDLNGTFSTPLASWLTGNGGVRFSRNLSESQRGLAGSLFLLAPDNAASPFDDTVALAIYRPTPLIGRNRRDSGEGHVTLNATLGRWTIDWNSRHQRLALLNRSTRGASGNIAIPDDVDPFVSNLAGLIALSTDRFESRTIETETRMLANGPVIALPAGTLTATLEARAGWDRLRSRSRFATTENSGDFRRSEQAARAALSIPLTSSAFLAGFGDSNASFEVGRVHYSDAGNASHYAGEINWEPRPVIRLSASIDGTETPAPVNILGDAVIATPLIRTYDPLTGQTVDVTQITGGNPDLKSQRTTIRRLNAILRLAPKYNLQLNAEYTDTDRRDFVSGLPEASAAVALAFPDRYVRDSNGVLTLVDLRPVNFESDREKRLRWGVSLSHTFRRSGPAPRTLPGGKRPPRSPSTSVQFSANHTIVFSDEIRIRSGLDPVDLLKGGAIGIGGGRRRNQVDANASINNGGLGARLGLNWRGPSQLQSRVGGIEDTLDFSSTTVINARVFADLKRFFPESRWAKGLRLSIDAINLTNDRQKVRDRFGNTPLQYQPGYREPIGRTLEFEIRKIF